MRFPEIDSLRGTAVVGMLIYHLLVDLEMFYGRKFGVFEYPVVILARVVGIMFVTLLGMSAFFLWNKTGRVRDLFIRGIYIFSWGMAVTGTTYVFFPHNYVRFGILHFLGLSMWLLIPFLFLHSKIFLWLIGLGIILAGNIFKINSPPTLDFYPVLPWFGLVVWGVGLGKIYLPWRKKQKNPRIRVKPIEWLGQHSLAVYIVHQPVILLLLWGFNSFFDSK